MTERREETKEILSKRQRRGGLSQGAKGFRSARRYIKYNERKKISLVSTATAKVKRSEGNDTGEKRKTSTKTQRIPIKVDLHQGAQSGKGYGVFSSKRRREAVS